MASATGKEDDFHSFLNSSPGSLETVKSLADKRKLKEYVNLIVV